MWFDMFWHKRLGRPYQLAKPIDTGTGSPVVLLHGIGRTGSVWKYVVQELKAAPHRIIAFDLLGFGDSPKPDWIDYDIDDHARSVIASVERQRLGEPAILVGHSMGSLVALRVARLRPDLVRHVVLYEMPLYDGLPQKRWYRLRLNAYFKLYKKIIQYQPTFNTETARLAERLAVQVAGLSVDSQTWPAFVKSLQSTIMQQTAVDDLKHLTVPTDVIYGRLDIFVIRGKPQAVFGKDGSFTTHTLRAGHAISPSSSRFLAKRIAAALERDARAERVQ